MKVPSGWRRALSRHNASDAFPVSLQAASEDPATSRVSPRELLAQLVPLVVSLGVVVAFNMWGVWLMNGARGFAAGESLWSKARQEAVGHLVDHVHTGEPAAFTRFDHALRIPLGDRRAREAMLASPPDTESARLGLLQGGNPAEDIPPMLWILGHLAWEPNVAGALRDWTEGDELITRLQGAALPLRALASDPVARRAAAREAMPVIEELDAELARLERSFSTHIGLATRRLERMLDAANMLLAAMLLLFGGLQARHMIRRRLHAEHRARRNRERLELATTGANDGIWDWHVRGKQMFWTSRTRELLGFERDADFRHYQLREEVHPEDSDRFYSALRSHFAGATDRLDLNLRLRLRNGSYRWFQMRGMAIRDALGEPLRMLGTLSDIHERVLSNLALEVAWTHSQRVADELDLALDGANVALWAYDPRSGAILHHKRWRALLGRDEMPAHFEGWLALTHPDDRERRLDKLRQHLDNLAPYYESEFRMRHADGHWVWVRSRGRATRRDTDGRALEYAGAVMNISDQVAAREIERREQQFLRAMIEGVDVGVMVSDDTRVVYANAAFRQLLDHHQPDALAGAALADVLPEAEREREAAQRDLAARGIDLPLRVVALRRGDGTLVRAVAHLSAVDWNGRPHFICTYTALSEHAALDQQVRALSGRFERALMAEIEAQQASIARELHDSLGSVLAGVTLLVGSAQGAGTSEPASALLKRAQGELARAVEMIRALSRGIMPVTALPGALRHALEQFAQDLQGVKGIACTLRLSGPVDAIPVRVANQVFRIVQEATTNALKHAQARRIDIELEVIGRELLLVVADDGRGFDADRVSDEPTGLGLKSMQARAATIHATLGIHSTPTGGCRVVLTATLPPV